MPLSHARALPLIITLQRDAQPMIKDTHLANLIRRCREELQNNRPVQAHMWLGDIEKYLADVSDPINDQQPVHEF